MAEVRVNLAANSYTIHIGTDIAGDVSRLLASLGFIDKLLVVTDDNVGKIYGDDVIKNLRKDGFLAELFCVRPGEDSKAINVAMDLYTKAITMGLDRKSPIVALGGGVVGDLAGFVAATYLRGVPFIQMPTSLLAQVDSSVGGKVAVNHQLGKNLIGAFYQPQFVLIDIKFLSTLPERELSTGLAELVKYGVIADRDLFIYLAENCHKILAKEPAVMTEIIRRSCEIKADIVEQDEKEASLRAILNFGHTIAHAIEADTGFKYNHGEAVAIGMHGAALLSLYLGMCQQGAVDKLMTVLANFKLPLTAPECRMEDLFPYFGRDKKTVGGKTKWVLLNDIGKVTITSDVPETIIKRVLAEITVNI